MDRNLEKIKNFVEGKLSIEDFERICKTDTDFRKSIRKFTDDSLKKYNYSILNFIDSANWNHPNDRMKLFVLFRFYLVEKHCKYVDTDQYIKAAQDYYSIIPDWLPDSASDWVEENILNNVPEGMNKTERKKWIKEQVEAIYPCAKRHPSWVQATSDWPKDKDGNNLTFVKQKEDGEEVTYTFIDPKTNEEVEVVEFY